MWAVREGKDGRRSVMHMYVLVFVHVDVRILSQRFHGLVAIDDRIGLSVAMFLSHSSR
jgi:hypothetical protein